MCVIAVTVPTRVKMSCSLSLVMCRATSASLMTPFDCRRTTHAVVRTSSDVHSGRSTISIMIPATAFGAMVRT